MVDDYLVVRKRFFLEVEFFSLVGEEDVDLIRKCIRIVEFDEKDEGEIIDFKFGLLLVLESFMLV